MRKLLDIILSRERERARRKALLEAARWFDPHWGWYSREWVLFELRRMAEVQTK
jgi:hypothetical protein